MNDRERLVPWKRFATSGFFRSGKGLPLVAALLLLIAFFARARKASVASFPVWVASSLLRVGKTAAPESLSSIELSGARGETVDSQIVVQSPPGGLTNVNLTASAFTGPNGATIPAASVTLYREHYLTVAGTANYGGGTNPPLGPGTYPEPLIPFNDPESGASLCETSAVLKACNASITPGQNQPYWIDIAIPRGKMKAPQGTYIGSISITADQGTVSIPVTLTVWNFELPVRPSELTQWTLWQPATGNSTTTLARALMRNKVMPWYNAPEHVSSDRLTFGLNRTALDADHHIQIRCDGTHGQLPATAQLEQTAAKYPDDLPLDLYVGDELNECKKAYPVLKMIGLRAHAVNRSIKTTLTLNKPDPNLFNEGDGRSAIDRWALLDSAQQWPAPPWNGPGELWSYASCNTGSGNTPEWMVDYPPINERIQAGFLNFTQGATGLLYYRADGWTAGNSIGSWNNVDTTACGGGFGRPGDGVFLYPPAPIASTESAPGIRLKAIRDGIQDYEYAQLLKNQKQDSFLDMVLKPVARKWSDWDHNPDVLETARQKMGRQLHELSAP